MRQDTTPMKSGVFPEVTVAMLVLTLMCVGVNALGWVRLRPLARLAFGAGRALTKEEIAGLGQLTGVIRLEVVYFTLLLIYALLYPGVLALGPVLFVVLYHGLGWAANELTRTTVRAVVHLRREPAPAPSFRARARLALATIGVLDAIEVMILVYIVIALARVVSRGAEAVGPW
jgi:hypothetical protein